YLYAVTSTGAAFNVSSPATLYFYSADTRSFDAASSIGGAGIVQWNGGTNTVSAPYNITGTTKAAGGTTTLNNITSIGDLIVSGTSYFYMENNAVLTNSGTIDFQGDGGLYLNSVVGTTAVVNSGTIKKSSGTASVTFNVPLTAQSGSHLNVLSGTFLAAAVA